MFNILFCTLNKPLECTKESHIAKLLSFCFVTTIFNQTNKYKTKNLIMKVLSRYDHGQLNIKLP